MRHPQYFAATQIVANTLDALLSDPKCVSAYLFFREGSVVALRGPASLPVDPSVWRVHLAGTRRGRVRVANEPAVMPNFVVTTGVTRRLILACGRLAKPGFKDRRAFRQDAEDLRRRLEDLLRGGIRFHGDPVDDDPSGVSGWAAVPLPPHIKPS